MGIFSKKSDDKPVAKKATPKKSSVSAETKAVKVKAPKVAGKVSVNAAAILKNPRITEKAAHISDNRVYTFDVFTGVSKVDIAKAVTAIYGVVPVRVNVSAIPKKHVLRKNTIGVKGGGRKAYVYLAKGDKIEFI